MFISFVFISQPWFALYIRMLYTGKVIIVTTMWFCTLFTLVFVWGWSNTRCTVKFLYTTYLIVRVISLNRAWSDFTIHHVCLARNCDLQFWWLSERGKYIQIEKSYAPLITLRKFKPAEQRLFLSVLDDNCHYQIQVTFFFDAMDWHLTRWSITRPLPSEVIWDHPHFGLSLISFTCRCFSVNPQITEWRVWAVCFGGGGDGGAPPSNYILAMYDCSCQY